MRVLMWNDYGELKILANDKIYRYEDVSWYMYRKIQRWIDHGYYGRVWQMLKKGDRAT